MQRITTIFFTLLVLFLSGCEAPPETMMMQVPGKGLAMAQPAIEKQVVKKPMTPMKQTVKPMVDDQEKMISRSETPPTFHRVIIDGPMNVDVLANTGRQDVRLLGDKEIVNRTKVSVTGDTLTIKLWSKAKFKKRLVAVVRANQIYGLSFKGEGRYRASNLASPTLDVKVNAKGSVLLNGKHIGLKNLDLAGDAKVTIKRIDSRDLSIHANGSNTVKIEGVANLRQLVFDGTGWLNLLWVNSPKLKVIGRGKAFAKLAGRVGLLDLKVYGNAFFNGQYLRTKVAYVKTFNRARADLQVTQQQHTLAKGQSNIYFYKMPKYKSTNMANKGTVLNMNGML